jgi:hypothetical protein
LRSDVPLVIRNATDTRKLVAGGAALKPADVSAWVQQQQAMLPPTLMGTAPEQLHRYAIAAAHSPHQSQGDNPWLKEIAYGQQQLLRQLNSIRQSGSVAAQGASRAAAGLEHLPSLINGASRREQIKMREQIYRGY